jgi:diguanylate cyclase (GGDEF)-like protein
MTSHDHDLEQGYAILSEQPLRALELAQAVRRAAGQTSDARQLGRALALEARVATRRGDLDAALSALLQAEPLLASCDAPDLLAEVAVAHARLAFYSGGYRDALERIEEAIAIADRYQLDRVRLDARNHLSLILGNMEMSSGLEVAREVVDLAVELGSAYEEAGGRNDVAYTLYERGELGEATSGVEIAVALAASLGNDAWYPLAYALGTRADIRLASGDAAAALADVGHVLGLLEDGDDPDPYLHGVTYEVRMRCLVALGLVDDAIAAGRRGLTVSDHAPPFVRGLLLRSLAEILRAAGDYEEAYSALAEGFVLERAVIEQQASHRLALQQASLEVAAARREANVLAAKNTELEELVGELHATKLELEQQMGQLEELRDQLREQADRDWLTGLRNRRWLARELPGIIDPARRGSDSVALALVDLDHFKSVNDRFGHEAGDRVLRAVADLLTQCVRDGDVVVRSGGEEFVVVMPATSREEALGCCERLRRALRERLWPELDGELSLTLSAGVVCADEPAESDDLLALADARLYLAKALGRDRIAA